MNASERPNICRSQLTTDSSSSVAAGEVLQCPAPGGEGSDEIPRRVGQRRAVHRLQTLAQKYLVGDFHREIAAQAHVVMRGGDAEIDGWLEWRESLPEQVGAAES